MAKKRGFASMDQAKQREIASKGGKAAHQKGTAHQFTQEEARAAGRKGGQAAHFKGTAHKFTSEEARAAGRKGGRSNRQAATQPTEVDMTPAPSSPAQETPETPPTETSGAFQYSEGAGMNSEANYGPGRIPVMNPAPSAATRI